MQAICWVKHYILALLPKTELFKIYDCRNVFFFWFVDVITINT